MEASEAKTASWWTSRLALSVLGVVMLAAWLLWWGDALAHNRLRGRRYLWLPIESVRGIDFYSNYFSGRAWAKGLDPYTDQTTPNDHPRICSANCYPPPTIWQFGWCRFFTLHTAKTLWLLASVGLFVAATPICLRIRRDLNLWVPPWPFALACVLCSSPVLFELERGQCNVLVLLHLLLAAAALRREDWLGDVCAGVLTAFAFWTKMYPLMLIAGLLPLRRWRAFSFAVVAAALLGVADLHGMAAFQRNVALYSPPHRPMLSGSFAHWQHALGGWWSLLWRSTSWDRLGQVPELLPTSCLLLPAIGLVSLAMFHLSTAARQRLTVPFLLWLTGVATFFSPMAYDYCLFFLPLAALAVADRRDSWAAILLLGMSVAWLQPLLFPVPPLFFMGFKLALIGALAFSLLARCQELTSAAVLTTARKSHDSPPRQRGTALAGAAG